MTRLGVHWEVRESPLPAAAVVLLDLALEALKHSLRKRDANALESLKTVLFDGGVALIGEERVLPWVDGGVYLGREPMASNLLVPTCLQPNVCADLFERALRRHINLASDLLAVVPHWQLVVPLNTAVAVNETSLLSN